MNEAETRAELIDPALKESGWGVTDDSRVRREEITPGRIQEYGERTKKDIADYVLIYKNKKLGLIEAKKRDLSASEGVAQAKKYADKMHIRFAYASNGDEIYQIDMETGEEKYIDSFPSPEDLWDLTFSEENAWRDRFAAIPFETKGGTWELRYYQHIAIEKTMDAIANGQQRILLTLATGTGKTAIAFQIVWKLFHARWNLNKDGGRRPRVLFLADRNILADQAYNAFSAFEEDALARIEPHEIRKKGKVPKNASIFFTIYQTFMSGDYDSGNFEPYFGEYPEDFFDFIIIDECHRGGANDESNWRAILDHFSPATQLGLTATPKRKGNVDTYSYFGEPIYTYSLKEGINDGFLTPFKVKQIATTLDEYVYTPDDELLEGEIEEGKRYREDEFNLTIEIKERERYRVQIFMNQMNQNDKTLVFCATQEHAALVRDYINQMKKSSNPDYCVRVTAEDGGIGEKHLRDFQDNEKTIPTILTTSRKLSTGVDARNIRNIVLMRPIKDIIEFKQIIGRGTRTFEDKSYFTIYDFVKAYEHFEDDEWDGEPVDQTTQTITGDEEQDSPSTEDSDTQNDDAESGDENGDADQPERPKKTKVKLADGKERTLQHMIATSFWSSDGKPMSATQFLESLYGTLPEFFKDEDQLREIWRQPDTRKKLLDELSEKGYGRDKLDEMKSAIGADGSDLYDVLAYIAFAYQPISREERVEDNKDDIFQQYDDKQQAFIDFVLSRYVQVGVDELEQEKLPTLVGLKYGSTSDASRELGSMQQIRSLFIDFQKHLY